MSTTALVIEHLIIGLQASLWFSLIVLTVFGWEWIDVTVIKDLSSVIAFFGLATVYPMGLFIDELADSIFKSWAKRIRNNRVRQEGANPECMEMTAMYIQRKSNDQHLKNYFNYIRMRIRVSRSTAINLGLITIFSLLFTSVRLHHIRNFGLIIFLEILLGLLLIALSIWVWWQVSNTFARQIVRASKSLSSVSPL